MPFFTVGELKAALVVKTNDANADLIRWEAAARAFVARYTGRYFGPPKVFTEILTGWGPDERDLWLSEAPLLEPAPVVVIEDVPAGAGTVLIRGCRLTRREGWPTTPDGIVVTYTAGYLPGEEPEEIRDAVMDLVAIRYRRRGMEGLGGEQLGAEYSVSVPASHVFTGSDLRLVPGLETKLNFWRRRRA